MERFWSKVDKRGPFPAGRRHLGRCWVWTAGKIPEGYGSFWWPESKQQKGAHVIAWLLQHGSFPSYHINHRCENKACVRPSHLEDVPSGVNQHYSKTTQASVNSAKTHCPAGHEYSPENTYTSKDGERQCRVCNRRSKRESWRRLHAKEGSVPRGPRRSAERGQERALLAL